MSTRNWLVALIALLVTCCAAPQVKGDYVVLYETDFSSDPGWITSNSDRFHWDPSDQTYYANPVNVNHGGYWTYKEVDYLGGNFRLQWDILPISVNYACDIAFGMFDATNISDSLGGQWSTVQFTTEDRGRTTALKWAKGTYHAGRHSVSPQWSPNTWYTVVTEYDDLANSLDAAISIRDTGQLLTSIHLDNVGPFDAAMNRIGHSKFRPGTFQVNGAQSWGKYDNVVFSVEQAAIPEPSTLMLLTVGGLTLTIGWWRRRRK